MNSNTVTAGTSPAVPANTHKLLSTKEAREVLRVSPATFYRMVEAGVLPGPIKIGRRSFWTTADIDRYLADRIAAREVLH